MKAVKVSIHVFFAKCAASFEAVSIIFHTKESMFFRVTNVVWLKNNGVLRTACFKAPPMLKFCAKTQSFSFSALF